jgi:hypothetical protein
VRDWAFWLWAVVGVGFGFGISQVGIFTVPASALVAIILLRQPRFRGSAFGVLVGIGAVLLLVAYLNREGPGTVCETHRNGIECAYGLPDPKKWAAAGLVLVVLGLLGHLRPARQSVLRG